MIDYIILFVVLAQFLYNFWMGTVLHNMVQGLYRERDPNERSTHA